MEPVGSSKTLITTHVGADFDALASMIAALHLYPEGILFFPGSKEESVRRYLDSESRLSFSELRQRQVVPKQLKRVVLCDIRQPARIGIVSDWLEDERRPELVIFDHHPDSEHDLHSDTGRVDANVGATSTLMVEILNERDLRPTAEEATLLLAGIYEDTGCLTYATTTPRDLNAARCLLDWGADLGVVRRFAIRQLDSVHLDVLHRMGQELEIHRIRGHRIGVVALELGRYIEELAPIVSRCLEIFELPALFALFGEGERVSLIARGDLKDVDLGEVLGELSEGGGHSSAAAGSLRGVTVLEARERLLRHLETTLPHAGTARELMVRPFHALNEELTVAQAKEELNRRQINAAPILDGSSRAIGAVTRQLLDAALQHDMDRRPVTAVMETDLAWEPAEASAERVAQRMLSRHPRFLLVGDEKNRRAEGLISRTAVLRYLSGRTNDSPEAGSPTRQVELKRRRAGIAELLEKGLPASLTTPMRVIIELSGELRIPVYLVGGLVRDLLLERPNRDLDIVVEGDGPAFARMLADRLDGRVTVHDAFMTAVVIDREEQHIDVATARSEFYRAPAALPEVRTSALRQDLYRRDFTINAMAIRLGPGKRPELIDFFGGLRDLDDGVLRVLHSLSFIDDPTRALRAVRLEARLDFHISPETLRLLHLALQEGVFARVSGGRLRDELCRILGDPDTVLRSLERLEELGILGVLDSALVSKTDWREDIRRTRAALEWARMEGVQLEPFPVWRLFLLALTWGQEDSAVDRLVGRLSLAREDQGALTQRSTLRRAITALSGGLRSSESAALLAPLTEDQRLFLMTALDPHARAGLRRYLVYDRHLELRIRGGDIVENGIPPGPAVGQALARTLAARLDGDLTADQELEYALRVARELEGIVVPSMEERSTR